MFMCKKKTFLGIVKQIINVHCSWLFYLTVVLVYRFARFSDPVTNEQPVTAPWQPESEMMSSSLTDVGPAKRRPRSSPWFPSSSWTGSWPQALLSLVSTTEGNTRYEEREFQWVDMFHVVRKRSNHVCDMKKYSDS